MEDTESESVADPLVLGDPEPDPLPVTDTEPVPQEEDETDLFTLDEELTVPDVLTEWNAVAHLDTVLDDDTEGDPLLEIESVPEPHDEILGQDDAEVVCVADTLELVDPLTDNVVDVEIEVVIFSDLETEPVSLVEIEEL